MVRYRTVRYGPVPVCILNQNYRTVPVPAQVCTALQYYTGNNFKKDTVRYRSLTVKSSYVLTHLVFFC